MPRHHLLAVWNPVYGRDVMEAHLRVLMQAARNHRAGRSKAEDVYVWWGKVRSRNRAAPLPHHDAILAIEHELAREDEGPETHVYLTDFHSLYVAHLGGIQVADPYSDRLERSRIPSYYHKGKELLACDYWFKLWDVRRLVHKDGTEVVHQVRKLRDTRHDDLPVSIYGGMFDLPLIVTEAKPDRFFDDTIRQRYIGDRFWVEYDTEQGGVGAIEREIRENMLGDEAWHAFGHDTRLFIATGEALYRGHGNEPGFDHSATVVEFCKALEVRCNWLLVEALRGASDGLRSFRRDDRSVVIDEESHLTLSELARVLLEEKDIGHHLRLRLDNANWFTGTLPHILRDVAKLRNPAAHQDPVDKRAVTDLRNRLMGVGCEGDFVNLSRVRLREH